MDASNDHPSRPASKRSYRGARLPSIAVLCAVLLALVYVFKSAYHVATDGFVAPIILSPDSDMVIQSKLSMSQLMAERIRITVKREEIDAELHAVALAVEQLQGLRAVATSALDWTSALSARQASGGAAELRALAHEKGVLAEMIEHQRQLLARLEKDLAAGLVARADYAREVQVLNQLTVAELETDRARISSEVNMSQAVMTQQALKDAGKKRAWSPEMLMRQDQLVRIDCDLLKLEAERRAKTAEWRQIDVELTKLDDLVAQLKQRPVFRATEANTNVAFVPYTQLGAVTSGANVYECFWGIVACERVGRIGEVLPGEVIVSDPWGTPARGQYATLELDRPKAAQARTLRVRPLQLPIVTLFSKGGGPRIAAR